MQAHGNLFIILKQSLRWTPLLGLGMSYFGFIWVSRIWNKDRLRLKHRLDQLTRWRYQSIFCQAPNHNTTYRAGGATNSCAANAPHEGGQYSRFKQYHDNAAPFWLLIFPEGTNLSKNTRAKSKSWAAKTGQDDLEHLLLPRYTGLLFCLRELQGSVEWLYDCTMGYEGVPYVTLF